MQDQRRGTDNLPLRKSTDVSFLTTLANKAEIDTLHECQTSICVTGWNVTQGWTAYCLKDSFFNDEADPNNESSLLFYSKDDDQEVQEGDVESTCCDMDAISLATLTADRISHKDPREYFLQIVLCHIREIRGEWDNTGYCMGQRIHEYVSVGPESCSSVSHFRVVQ